MNLNAIDLNLLTAFVVLMEEKSVTRAANRLCVSQSAMSHTLRRLRTLFDDPVLVATPSGMQPTPRAVELIVPVRQALELLEKSLGQPAHFDPAISSMSFVLGSTDYVEYVLVPPLIRHLSEVAPKISIQMGRFQDKEIEEQLEKRKIDVVIRPTDSHTNRLNTQNLFSEVPVVLAGINHPAIGKLMNRQLYISLRHVVVESFAIGDQAVCDMWGIDDSLRTVALRTPSFRSTPMILAETDLIATLPMKAARMFIRGGRLQVVPFPIEIEPFNMEMVWHSLLDKDLAQVWFRQQLITVAEKLDEELKQP